MNLVGYFHGNDPAACLLMDGELRAFVEEERLIRYKHAPDVFPIRSIATCLELGGLELADVDAFVYGWDAPRYGDGGMAEFFARINERYLPDRGTLAWQKAVLSLFRPESLEGRLRDRLVRWFGVAPEELPPLHFVPHHETHAAAAFYLSPCDEALVITVDGSGDSDCTSVWHGRGRELERLWTAEIPHSLGWFYAALTEHLGFRAYDGEYKVMGLAAYGRENLELRARLEQVLHPGPEGWDYELEPRYIHHGLHTWSDRFTDDLVELLEVPPRLGGARIEQIHEDLAYETQRALEECVLRLAGRFQRESGLDELCIGGGVGLNVKMNSRLRRSGLFRRVFPFPIPGDSGLGIGATVAHWIRQGGARPAPLGHLYLGPAWGDDEIEEQLRACGLAFRRPQDVCAAAAELLAGGKVVAWFQGPMEAGPRALGGRSILADPRDAASRDRVNAAIKFREYWRPFCPSLTEESASRFLEVGEPAPYMILAYEATEEARQKLPAVVHVDDTVRVQTVAASSHARYHRLLEAFAERTGVPVVLNTSFNVRGEAIVCSPRDALRTFWSTGIDALAIGPFLVEKPEAPTAVEPEEVLR